MDRREIFLIYLNYIEYLNEPAYIDNLRYQKELLYGTRKFNEISISTSKLVKLIKIDDFIKKKMYEFKNYNTLIEINNIDMDT